MACYTVICMKTVLCSDVDNCVYVKHIDDKMTVIVIWVDDLIIGASNDLLLWETQKMLKDRFKMKDLGKL